MKKTVIQRSDWESGIATPPMPQKRKNAKKERKSKIAISTPFNVKYVDMVGVPHQLQDQTKYPVEHIVTMPVEKQLTSLSPSESLEHVRNLLQDGATLTKQVLLCVTNTVLIVKDGITKEAVLQILLANIRHCTFISMGVGSSSILMVNFQDDVDPTTTQTHFFQCSKTPAAEICNEIEQARKGIFAAKVTAQVKQMKGVFLHQSNLVSQTPVNHPPPPAVTPPLLPMSTDIANIPFLSPPTALPSSPEAPLLEGTDPNEPVPYLAATDEYHGLASQQIAKDSRTSSSSKNATLPLLKFQGEGGEISEMRRRMKASRIQRDVDILNHVIEDLDDFICLLKSKAAAWNEFERKKKRSKRKKHYAAMEELRLKAEPPGEEEFKEIYSKCKFAINLIAKLGHHLSAPSASEFQAGIFSNYISHFVSVNKGPQLAACVISPLLTQRALVILERKLPSAQKEIWKQLGTNWFLTSETWPENAPEPPDYAIHFRDGCIPPNLHNASDCPANFPTLNTLPREKRQNYPEYSDAYDMDQQPEAESALMINPAVKAAVESQFAAVATIPKGEDKVDKPVSQQGRHRPKFGEALFSYTALSKDELSIHKGQFIEVLDDSRKWWKVKNHHGQTGYIPGNLVKVAENQIDLEVLSATATGTPSPSLISRRSSVSQPGHSIHMQLQQSTLSPLLEEPEVHNTTTGSPKLPVLPPPPSFSPSLPHQQPILLPVSPAAHSQCVPPPPPPPPPIIPQKPPMSLSEIISQHKKKTMQEGKGHKPSVMKKEKNESQFDITEALKMRKPLRKTTKANLMVDVHQEECKKPGVLYRKGDNGTVGPDEPDMHHQVLPWRADANLIKLWLIDQGYASCSERLSGSVTEGSHLYAMSRQHLRDMFGSSDGVRLYSQLQADKVRSEQETGVVKETEFQKMMRIRKRTLDHHKKSETEPSVSKKNTLQITKDRETTIDSGSSGQKLSATRKQSSAKDGRNVDNPQYTSKRGYKQASAEQKGDHRRPQKESSSYVMNRRERRTLQSTNIDEYEEDRNESESDSDVSSYSEISSSSDEKYQQHSSASASNIANATWALQGSEGQAGVVSEARIKQQQEEIKMMLSHLRELQKVYNLKALPAAQQGILRRDLQNLESIQRKQHDMPGNVTLLSQLLGQQLILTDHLREAIAFMKGLPFTLSTTGAPVQQQQPLKYQSIPSHQHAVLMQQQFSTPLTQQHLLLEAEHQQQQQLLLAAAEQQRLGQLSSQPQRLLGPYLPLYSTYSSPYSGVTYF